MVNFHCPSHPKRKVTHLIHRGTAGAADQLVCAECAEQVEQSRLAGARSLVRVQPVTLIPLPAPTVVRCEGAPEGALLHIAEARIREVGNVACCGAVLKTWTVIKNGPFVKEGPAHADACLACGTRDDFKMAADTYARWVSSLQR